MIKQLICLFLFPLPFSAILILLGVILLWTTRRRVMGKLLVSIGSLVLIFSSVSFLSSPFVESLENNYPALLDNEEFHKKTSGIPYVVVLGNGYSDDLALSLVSRQTDAQLARLIEGIYLHRRIPNSKLILSGGSRKKVSEAESMSQLAVALGINRENILVESNSKNTYQEAVYLKKMLGEEPFLLVTSALHMKRAAAIFRKLGMNPIPAPTDHFLETGASYPYQLFSPSSRQIGMFETALYERLGWIKEYLLGRI